MAPARGLMSLLLLGLGLACGDIKGLLVLQQSLAREFQTRAINLKLSSGQLTVVFTNSSNAELPEPDRAAFARRVAEHVRDHYPPYEQLQNVQVGFATVHGAGGFTISRSSIPYRFTTSELGSPKGLKQGTTLNAGDQDRPGQRVLVIMISRADRHSAWLITGRVQATDSKFEVIPDSGVSPVAIADVDMRHNAFEPGLLPHLVGAEYWTLANQLSHEVSRCIPMLVDDVPMGARAVPGFLSGLATVQDGRIFLMPR